MTMWMIWATLVTGLLGVAGLAFEHLLRGQGRPTRWAWVAALGAILGLQVWSLIRPVRGVGSTATAGAIGIPAFVTEVPQGAITTVAAFLSRADTFLVAVWLAGTIVLAASLAGGLWRLQRRMLRWPRARVGGKEVWLSDGFGPAVVGFFPPRIILPRWILGLRPEQLRLAFLHEWEHRAARDTLLLLASSTVVVLAPWNAAMWWVASRLRQAVELDCDRRVLCAGASRSAYGELLIDMSSDSFASQLPVAALAKPASLLERRLKMITTDMSRSGLARSASLGAIMALLTIVACQAPAPSAINDDGDAHDAEVPSAEASLSGQLGTALNGRAASIAGEPLVIVDGVILEGIGLESLEGIDPESIERIEVLKGEAATSIYGLRGADGVIQIFTRDTSSGSEDVAVAPAGGRSTVLMLGEGRAEGDPKIYIDGKLISAR